MNDDLVLLSNWFRNHSLLPSDKTKVMFFNLSNVTPAVSNSGVFYHKSGCDDNCGSLCFEIENVSNFRYLGILLDVNLNFKAHIDELLKYCSLVLRKFYILKNLCPQNILRIIYFALVQ